MAKAVFIQGRGLLALAMFAVLAPAFARAACTRSYDVPVGADGYEVAASVDLKHGIIPDYFAALAAKTDCSFRIVALPTQRTRQRFAAGQLLLYIGIESQPAAITGNGYFLPVVSAPWTLLVRKDSAYRNSEEVLSNPHARIGVNLGKGFPPQLQQMIDAWQAAGRLDVAPTQSLAFNKLVAGRDEGLLETEGAEGKDTALLRPLPVAEAGANRYGVFLANRMVDADRAIIAAGMAGLARDGTPKKVFGRYLKPQALAVMRFVPPADEEQGSRHEVPAR